MKRTFIHVQTLHKNPCPIPSIYLSIHATFWFVCSCQCDRICKISPLWQFFEGFLVSEKNEPTLKDLFYANLH